jgi:CheY-like chemotaxis protein
MPTNGTILVVDDSRDDVDLLLRMFRQIGVGNPVDVCYGGAEALDYLRQHKNNLPAVMLLDLKMPGHDGFWVLNKVKSNPLLRDIVVIVLTTSSDIGDIKLAYELGSNSFLTKPVDLGEFRAMVGAFHKYWVISNQPPPKRGRWVKKPEEDEDTQ